MAICIQPLELKYIAFQDSIEHESNTSYITILVKIGYLYYEFDKRRQNISNTHTSGESYNKLNKIPVEGENLLF